MPSVPRADAGAARLRSAGLEVDAALVGDPDPIAAIGDLLLVREYDEIVVATLPRGISRWLRVSLPQRVRRMTALPVTHVVAHPRRAGRPTRRRELSAAAS